MIPYLINIAQRAYDGNGSNFRLIYDANRDVIGNNPDVIVPGQRLFIPRL